MLFGYVLMMLTMLILPTIIRLAGWATACPNGAGAISFFGDATAVPALADQRYLHVLDRGVRLQAVGAQGRDTMVTQNVPPDAADSPFWPLMILVYAVLSILSILSRWTGRYL